MLATSVPPLLLLPDAGGQAVSSSAGSVLQPSSSCCQSSLYSPSTSCGLSLSPASGQRRPIPSKPKLRLQTRCLPISSGASSTRLSLLSSGTSLSPTTYNTFKNAYDVRLASPATAPPLEAPGIPRKKHTGLYQFPRGVKGILRNSPNYASFGRQPMATTVVGSSQSPASHRTFFPAKKRVSYRCPLEEEIQTVRYTARHSDLFAEPCLHTMEENMSANDSDFNSCGELFDSGNIDDNADDSCNRPDSNKWERKKRRRLDTQRQIRTVAFSDRAKGNVYSNLTSQALNDDGPRHREWKWTLEPTEMRNKAFGLLSPILSASVTEGEVRQV